MDAWIDIRWKARQCHQEALKETQGDRRASALITAALKNDDLHLRPFHPGSKFGDGVYGLLERANGIVNVARNQCPADEAVVIAHEIGHYRLHRDPTSEVTIRSGGLGGDPIDSGAGKVEGYSPRERKEVQADVFAGEFLCPSDRLREEFVLHGRRPCELATELGIPPHLVMNQFIRALLLPQLRAPGPQLPSVAYALDDSQKIAATWNKGALLVDAGPGTGKTRTLVHRIKHLLDRNILPGSILALTFSKKAAEEMRERLSAMNADAAIEMWVDTFHAFGRELLMKWPSSVGRTVEVQVLDQAGSLALLEDNLADLPLHHYQNLYEPAYELVNVLRAISRCKDECISPAVYLEEGRSAFDAATTDEEREIAERAIEVAEIYQIYEDALVKADAVDFGDLVLLAAKLVEGNSSVKEYIAGFKHVLVDEYQDVNFASARLLRAICATGAEAWVVADGRQSIYRFRGAEPSNVTRFVEEFGGARQPLANNYRSFSPIVRTFQQFSTSMGGTGAMAGSWNAVRENGGEVMLTVAPTVAAEAEAIRDNIEAFRKKGVPYSDQAILARTHLTLTRLTTILEQLGVPLLYLGDLFERDEIRTLLSLVAIDAEFGGIGLLRVAALPEYQATRNDALIVISWAHTQGIKIFDALRRISEIDGLTDTGRAGLAKLGMQLEGLADASPWTLLTTWLFERSNYLRPLLVADDVNFQQKLVAIYHLLKVCGEQIVLSNSSRRRFLDRIRRIEALNYDSSYRAVASEAADLDAVRVMTIHGSKGLEFGAVHFPALATRYMPSNRQGTRCPPPPSLAKLAMQAADHEAEEECLFFVGLSRARDYLSLSRAEQYTTQKATPSKFLSPIMSVVPARRYDGTGAIFSSQIDLRPPGVTERYNERDLSLYMQCPARYRYAVIEGLRGSRDESAYVRFHRCVYVAVRWLEREREDGRQVDVTGALSRLSTEWQANGPIDHPFERYYRSAAEGVVKGMATAIATEAGQYDRGEWEIPVGSRIVAITPDRVLITPGGVVRVQRIRTGRETKSEPDKPIYALLRRGAALRYAGKPVSVETFYLATSKSVPTAAKNDDKRLKDYADAIAAIEQGEFEAAPDQRSCPNCPCYFMCRG
jgi:DNA helicase-2/ATP-dependent DNA helicase PcrA